METPSTTTTILPRNDFVEIVSIEDATPPVLSRPTDSGFDPICVAMWCPCISYARVVSALTDKKYRHCVYVASLVMSAAAYAVNALAFLLAFSEVSLHDDTTWRLHSVQQILVGWQVVRWICESFIKMLPAVHGGNKGTAPCMVSSWILLLVLFVAHLRLTLQEMLERKERRRSQLNHS